MISNESKMNADFDELAARYSTLFEKYNALEKKYKKLNKEFKETVQECEDLKDVFALTNEMSFRSGFSNCQLRLLTYVREYFDERARMIDDEQERAKRLDVSKVSGKLERTRVMDTISRHLGAKEACYHAAHAIKNMVVQVPDDKSENNEEKKEEK